MPNKLTNIHEAQWKEQSTPRGTTWSSLDLSGQHLGVRLEATPPGGSSSVHHYHTLEEEHVLALEGEAVLIFGDEEIALKAGDHCWFEAGDETAHHIENRSDTAEFKFLVFGERKSGDVVVYPRHKVMMVKALEWKQFIYEPRETP